MILFRDPTDDLPDVFIERAKLISDCDERFSVLNRRRNLELVAHDARIREQLRDLSLVVTRDLLRIEVVEGEPVILPFVQDRRPAQASLRSFEDEHLEKMPIIMIWNAPFFIVIS